MWWNNNHAGIMIIQAPEAAEDGTAALTCAAIYHIATCPKLIYSFDPASSTTSKVQLVEMLRTLTIAMLTLQDVPQLSDIFLPSIIGGINSGPTIIGLTQLITTFHQVLTVVVTSCDNRILFVIDGMEIVGANGDDELSDLVRSFVSGFASICRTDRNRTRARVKLLISCKGYATALYGCGGYQDIVDFTDDPMGKVNIMQELEANMNASASM